MEERIAANVSWCVKVKFKCTGIVPFTGMYMGAHLPSLNLTSIYNVL